MSTNQPIARPEELLAHQGFLRGLIHSLVFDHEQAEDYLQETWAYAFRKPPRSGPGLKAWLATVARNFIRQDRRARGRRDLREAARAVPEVDTTGAKAVERERLRRRVVDAVLDLSEPYRTAVVLRYLDDLPPREIAKRTGAPVETVRTRIKRAMAMLRTRFDDEHGGDRRAWCMAFVPLLADHKKAAAAAGGASLLGGLLLMSTRTKVTVAAVLIAALFGIAYVLTPPGAADVVRPDAPPAEAPPVEVAVAPPVEEPMTEPPVIPEPPAPPPSRVGVSFVDSDGRAISVEEVVRRYADAGVPLEVRAVPESLFTGNSVADMLRMRVQTADEWAAAFPLAVGPESIQLENRPEPGQYRLFLGRPGAAPMVTETFALDADGEVNVPVHLPSESELVRVRLVEKETGAALAGATVTPLFEYGDDHMFIPGSPLTADSQGLVLIPLLVEKDMDRRQPSWWAETKTHLGLISHWGLSQNQPGLEMKLPVARKAVVAGKAWLGNGQPAAGRAIVWMGKGLSTVTTVAEDGSFRIDPVAVDALDDRKVEIILVEDLETFQVKQTRAKAVAGETIEVTIGEPAGTKTFATVKGRVTIGGKPVDSAFVVIRTEGGDKGFVKAGSDGTYLKEDVQAGSVRVSIWFGDPRTIDDFCAHRLESVEMGAGEVHTFDFELPTGAFRVKVVDDETGKPIAAAVATARPTEPQKGVDWFPGFRYVPGWGLRTGPDGAAVLFAMLPGEEHTIAARADGYEKAETAGHLPGTHDRPLEVTIRLKKK